MNCTLRFPLSQENLEKTWDGKKSVVTLKSKTKTSPNSKLIVILLQIKLPSLRHLIVVNVGSNLGSKMPKAKNPFC